MADNGQDNTGSDALLGIGQIVERLQNNSSSAEFDDKAQDEFLSASEALRKYYDQLEKLRFIQDTDAVQNAATDLQQQADAVEKRRKELEQVAKDFQVVAQFLGLLDDALTIAAALKP